MVILYSSSKEVTFLSFLTFTNHFIYFLLTSDKIVLWQLNVQILLIKFPEYCFVYTLNVNCVLFDWMSWLFDLVSNASNEVIYEFIIVLKISRLNQFAVVCSWHEYDKVNMGDISHRLICFILQDTLPFNKWLN